MFPPVIVPIVIGCRAPQPVCGSFVFVDGRLLVTTTRGLYAIEDDPEAPPAVPGSVLRAEAKD